MLCLLTKFHSKFEDKAFRVVVDTYVTDADGTGIVHQAPAFGEDDHRIAMAHGVLEADDMPPCPIDDRGHFTQDVPDFVGLHVKVMFLSSSGHLPNIFIFPKAADSPIQKLLKTKGRLIVQSTLNHSYPFCWRYLLIYPFLWQALMTPEKIRHTFDLPSDPVLVC